MKSLYIHIPFCRRKCFYCDFYSVIYESNLARDYIDVLCDQIKSIKDGIFTIYVGGGTPSILELKPMERFLKSFGAKVSKTIEFTIEANPESLDPQKLKLMADHGVNRLSIGLQSLDDRKLKKLGRIHNAAKGIEAVKLAVRSGIDNISIDLIFGVWGEALDQWKDELEEATKLSVKHISCYSLTYEKGTPLFKALENKSVAPLEDDMTASMYEFAIDRLSLRGFKQYEVSSFARDDYRSKHNSSYWDNNPYIGLGASAASYIDGVRTKNVSSVSEYVRLYREGRSVIESSEKLSPEKRARETAAIKIRTSDGIDFKWFKAKTGYDLEAIKRRDIDKLLKEGFIKYKKNNGVPTGICLTRKGFLFCDTVSIAML